MPRRPWDAKPDHLRPHPADLCTLVHNVKALGLKQLSGEVRTVTGHKLRVRLWCEKGLWYWASCSDSRLEDAQCMPIVGQYLTNALQIALEHRRLVSGDENKRPEGMPGLVGVDGVGRPDELLYKRGRSGRPYTYLASGNLARSILASPDTPASYTRSGKLVAHKGGIPASAIPAPLEPFTPEGLANIKLAMAVSKDCVPVPCDVSWLGEPWVGNKYWDGILQVCGFTQGKITQEILTSKIASYLPIPPQVIHWMTEEE